VSNGGVISVKNICFPAHGLLSFSSRIPCSLPPSDAAGNAFFQVLKSTSLEIPS